MKRTIIDCKCYGIYWIIAIVIFGGLVSCVKDDFDDNRDISSYFPFKNNALPTNVDSLRILVFGNSFSEDANVYLDQMVMASGIDEKRLCVYMAAISGAGISTWLEKYDRDFVIDSRRTAGAIDMKDTGKMIEVLHQNWDVIVVLQSSKLSYVWKNFYNLPRFIKTLTTNCANPNVCLVYHMPWSHTPEEMPKVLDGNIECYKRLAKQCGIDVLIPTGTAVQLARSTRLNDAKYLTRDNWHLNEGMGRYVASCTWFQSLIAPAFNVDIVGNHTVPKGNYSDEDVALAQKCAKQAVNDPFNYSSLR